MNSGVLEQKKALVTGASRGIGAAVAKRFAAEGAHVILVGRDEDGLAATDDAIRATGGNATLVVLDLAKPELVEQLAKAVQERFGGLDILVGNAGLLGSLTPLAHDCPSTWQKVMDVNLNANWHLIRCFDAMLQSADAGRAIFVTSGVTEKLHPYWGAYATSKVALEHMVTLYAAEVKHSRLKVNLLDPGRVRTDMRASAFPGEDPMTLPHPDDITDAFVDLASPACDLHGVKWYIR